MVSIENQDHLFEIIYCHIISYHIVDLKRQNRLKVGTNKPKLKVKMQSVSDDDVRPCLLHTVVLHLRTTLASC